MSETARFWALIGVVAAGTFALRSLPIWFHGRVPAPKWLERVLHHVPAVALTALVVPGSVYLRSSGGAYEFAPARILAALVAFAVAVRTRSILATLAVGMIALWIAQALL